MDGKRKCPTLAINEEQANIVRSIFEWYVNENIGTQIIADRLNNLNLSSPRGSKWSPDSIRTIVENPIYIGKVRWNTRKEVHVVRDGEIIKTRPLNEADDFILVDGKHEAIISEELFNAALEKRGRTHRACANKELRNPLASLLYCDCGRAMSYRHSTRGNYQYREPRLVCNGQKYCNNGSCSVEEVMPFIVEALRRRIVAFEVEAKGKNDELLRTQERFLEGLEKKLSDIESREIALWESQLDAATRMPPNVVRILTAKIEKEREETENAIKKAREEMVKPIDYEKQTLTFQQALNALLDDEISVAEKNFYLKKCINRITYHRDPIEKAKGKGNGRGYIHPPIKLDIKLRV
jgi:ATP-dependent Lon protease